MANRFANSSKRRLFLAGLLTEPVQSHAHRFLCAMAVVLCAARVALAVDFEREVLPILKAKCFSCHGEKLAEGGLRLDVRRRAMLGGDSGTTITPGSAKKSELIVRITATDESLRMPRDAAALSKSEVAAISKWIDEGAKWPDEFSGNEKPSNHWAFQRVRRPEIPRGSRSQHPIDAFLMVKLNEKGLWFSQEADPRTLIRRLYLDLLGLPPPVKQIQAFVNDHRREAYSDLVDRLLASKHFGERWARHWLDLARFAESDGYENDRIRTHAYRYRDWVIDAMNRDLPFDQFAIYQLAGDLLPKATEDQKIATGFHRNTLWNSAASADKEEFRIRAIKDRTNTTGTVWMGLTLRCCQCHSHKYDPIAQREYYRMYAFFNRTDNYDLKVTGGQAQTIRAVQRSSYVHRRGNFLDRGPEVTPHTPIFLPELKSRSNEPDRLDLARWLVDPNHPLTARVAVNRFWKHLFGRGLVPTPENFGQNGEPPTHPKLLDWLASEFVRLGWNRKKMIKLIVMSDAYRQSSSIGEAAAALKLDSENRLVWRQNRIRVEAEIVRDLALSVSGLLNAKIGGPSVVPPFPTGLLDFRLTNEGLRRPGGERYRRGIYIHVQRTMTFPTLAAFDAADGNEPCIRRDRSTTPMQALALLNDPVFADCGRALGKRIEKLSEDSNERLKTGFELCFGRPPESEELQVLRALVDAQRGYGASESEVWYGVARTMINLEQFITRE